MPEVTTGNQNTRVSMSFTAAAIGKKLPPLILIPRKNPLKHFVPPQNVLVVYGTNGFGEMFSDEHEHSESDNEHNMNMD